MIKTVAKKVVFLLEHKFDAMTKLGIALFSILLIFALGVVVLKKPNVESPTVKILRMDEKSGGSGVVISSGISNSQILTNNHVCDILKNGGIVRTSTDDTHLVSRYYKSNFHDICLLEVRANLKVHAKISKRNPGLYEEALISGHPSLLPLVVSKGHFSGNQVIQVLTELKECSKEDLKNPNLVFFCVFLGGIPILKSFEATLVTAMIMPGSSGSGVYNSDNELSGLAFAGNGQMSYAYVVPFEQVNAFINDVHSGNVEEHMPNYIMTPKMEKQQDNKTTDDNKSDKGANKVGPDRIQPDLIKLREACNKSVNAKIKQTCDIVLRDFSWGRVGQGE